jgi:WXXGXW repeat (2 copies)
MAHRAAAFVLTAIVTALASGCVEQPVHDHPVVVHRPLMDRYYAGDLVVQRAPPAFVVESVQVRRGYVWIHSYYRWDGHDYVAVPGRWEPERSGYRYVDARWERHRDGWHYRPGHWLSF